MSRTTRYSTTVCANCGVSFTHPSRNKRKYCSVACAGYKPQPRIHRYRLDGSIEVGLTQGQVAIIDSEDADLLQINWYTMRIRRYSYAVRLAMDAATKKKHALYLHRVILTRILDRELQEGELCDHIDGDTLNNRRNNLRVASHADNMQNSAKPKNNTSGYKGVRRTESGKWEASICVNSEVMRLGTFDTPEEAFEVYCNAAERLHGDFARFE